jgi:hypothetical protein
LCCAAQRTTYKCSAILYIYYYLYLRPSIGTTTSAPRSLPKLVTTIVLQEYSSAVSLSIEVRSSVSVSTVLRTKLKKSFPFPFQSTFSTLSGIPSRLLPASSFSSPACIAANPLLPFNFRFRFHFTSTVHNPQSTIHNPPPRPSVRWLLHAFTAPLKRSILLVLPRAVTVVHTVMTQHRQGSGKVSISKDATLKRKGEGVGRPSWRMI